MENVRAGVLHDGLRGQRDTDIAAGDRPPSSLHAWAEDGVRRDPQQQSRCVRLLEKGCPARSVNTDRLLRPHVFARGEGRGGDLDVHRRNGEIHDDLDLGVGENIVGRTPLRHLMLLGLLARTLHVAVTEDHNRTSGNEARWSKSRCR